MAVLGMPRKASNDGDVELTRRRAIVEAEVCELTGVARSASTRRSRCLTAEADEPRWRPVRWVTVPGPDSKEIWAATSTM